MYHANPQRSNSFKLKKLQFIQRKCCKIKIKLLSLHSLLKESIQGDSLAQQVEHIPFKDGVLGSSPRRITENKSQKATKLRQTLQIQRFGGFFYALLSRIKVIKKTLNDKDCDLNCTPLEINISGGTVSLKLAGCCHDLAHCIKLILKVLRVVLQLKK